MLVMAYPPEKADEVLAMKLPGSGVRLVMGTTVNGLRVDGIWNFEHSCEAVDLVTNETGETGFTIPDGVLVARIPLTTAQYHGTDFSAMDMYRKCICMPSPPGSIPCEQSPFGGLHDAAGMMPFSHSACAEIITEVNRFCASFSEVDGESHISRVTDKLRVSLPIDTLHTPSRGETDLCRVAAILCHVLCSYRCNFPDQEHCRTAVTHVASVAMSVLALVDKLVPDNCAGSLRAWVHIEAAWGLLPHDHAQARRHYVCASALAQDDWYERHYWLQANCIALDYMMNGKPASANDALRRLEQYVDKMPEHQYKYAKHVIERNMNE